MEGASASGTEAATSGEQIELEVERLSASDDQSSPCAEDNSHDQEEGIGGRERTDQLLTINSFHEFLWVISSSVGVDDEKPPAYDAVAQQELPTVRQKSNTLIGKVDVSRAKVLLNKFVYLSPATAEAPPSYQQLFGRKSSSSLRRPHTRSRRRDQTDSSSDHGSWITQFRHRYPTLSKVIIRCK